jgi:Mce-associated membrane protein
VTEKTTSKPRKTDEETSAVTVESDELTHEITESGGEEVTEATEDDIDVAEAAEAADEDEDAVDLAESELTPGINWSRVLAFALLPALALLLGAAAAFLKWQDASVRESDAARIESLQVAKDSTIRMLSYKPATVEQDLTSARDLLAGDFRNSYTQLTDDVVIPGAKQKQIAAIANVPAMASVSAKPDHAVVLVFVNQTVTEGDGAPTSTASSVQVTLDKVGDRWLISGFDPV